MVKNTLVFCGEPDTDRMADVIRTQYGYSCVFGGLRLHAGKHIYNKRGAQSAAFVYDELDYRYESLLDSLGVPKLKYKGALIGCLYDSTPDEIRFRITETGRTHLLLVANNDPVVMKALSDYMPELMRVSPVGESIYAIISLSTRRDVHTDDTERDDVFDDSADDVDLCDFHATDELSDDDLAKYRLAICGF